MYGLYQDREVEVVQPRVVFAFYELSPMMNHHATTLQGLEYDIIPRADIRYAQ